MKNYVVCYRVYVDYFKTTFPYTALPIYEEWVINVGVKIDTDSQTRSILEFSGIWKARLVKKKYFKTKNVSKREKWSKEQAGILVNIQATLHVEFITFRHFKTFRFLLNIFCI